MGNIYEVLARDYRDQNWVFAKSTDSFLTIMYHLLSAMLNYDIVDFRKKRL